MRRWWKLLAERADKSAFSADEVAEALPAAMESECLNEMTSDFRDGLRRLAVTPSLFGPNLTLLDGQELSGFERRVCDQLALLSPAEWSDTSSVLDALENVIVGEVPRYLRQIQEHYLRKASRHRARHLRDRLGDALESANLRAVGEKLLGRSSANGTARVSLKTGLDDGVKLK